MPATDDDFLSLVEEEWYARTKGELFLGTVDDDLDVDRELSKLVLRLRREARDVIENTAQAQTDQYGTELEQVTDEELASRIAACLDLLWAGGRRWV